MLSQTKPAPFPQPPEPLSADMASHWALDPSIAFLNHGSFGARTLAVMAAQSARRAEYESHPIDWLDRRRHALIGESKRAIGALVGADPANFGFVTNATEGINAVLRSLKFHVGDELLTTTHVYNGVRQTMRYLAEQAGATYRELEIPLPLKSSDEIVSTVTAALNERTRILLIDHITSPTAVIFPVERIVELCKARGLDVLIDGAHAPGMIPLNIEELGAAYYSANLHKWVCAPSGAGFLWVRRDKQPGIHPTTISHFLNENFINEFNWQGTRDITPWLCAKDAIEDMARFGWDRIMRHNHQLAVWVQAMLCKRWNVKPATPLDGSMIGSMATVLLPTQDALRERFAQSTDLGVALYDRYHIEVPVVVWSGRWWVRPCCQIYNIPRHYEQLADAVLELAS